MVFFKNFLGSGLRIALLIRLLNAGVCDNLDVNSSLFLNDSLTSSLNCAGADARLAGDVRDALIDARRGDTALLYRGDDTPADERRGDAALLYRGDDTLVDARRYDEFRLLIGNSVSSRRLIALIMSPPYSSLRLRMTLEFLKLDLTSLRICDRNDGECASSSCK